MDAPSQATHTLAYDGNEYALDVWTGQTWKKLKGGWEPYRLSMEFKAYILKVGKRTDQKRVN